jgi:hypothetical protein
MFFKVISKVLKLESYVYGASFEIMTFIWSYQFSNLEWVLWSEARAVVGFHWVVEFLSD